MTPNELKRVVLIDPYFGRAIGFVLGKLGNVRDMVVYDSGCGTGKMSVLFALGGARVIGIDKRKSAIDSAMNLACDCGVNDMCQFQTGNVELPPLEDGSVDIVFSRSVLQYTNRKRVLSEYARMVKADGTVVLVENLPYNPCIIIYRICRRLFNRTEKNVKYLKTIQGYITPDEIDRFAAKFKNSSHREFHLFYMLSILLGLPSRKGWLFKRMDGFIASADEMLLRIFPFLRRFAWFVALYCQGKKENVQAKNDE